MFKVVKIEKNNIEFSSRLLPNASFSVFDVWVDISSIDEIVKYFQTNNIELRYENDSLIFRIATITENYLLTFFLNEEKLSQREKIVVSLEFDKCVTDKLLFGIGYEKSGMSDYGKQIRFLIRDELLRVTELNKYCTVDTEGWIIPRLCIYGVFTNKI